MMIWIKNKQTFPHALINGEIFEMTLEQGLDHVLSDKGTFDDTSRSDNLRKDNRDTIVDYS